MKAKEKMIGAEEIAQMSNRYIKQLDVAFQFLGCECKDKRIPSRLPVLSIWQVPGQYETNPVSKHMYEDGGGWVSPEEYHQRPEIVPCPLLSSLPHIHVHMHIEEHI